MIFCPTPWLKAPALGGGQTPQSRGCGPGKLRGERRPGGHRLVGKGQPGRDFPDPCDYGLGHFSRFFFYSCGHTLSEVRSAGYTGPAWERSHTHTHTYTHTHTHSHTHTHTLTFPKVLGASTHRAGYPGRWPGNTHARPPSDVNKPRTLGLRASVQGLFSPSHVLAHTAPGPAWADADARQPALPLPA